MDDGGVDARRSAGRSVYAVLIPFPIACLVGTLLSDLAYLATLSGFWATASAWLLAVGIVGVGLAVIGGIADLIRSRHVRGLGRSLPRIAGEFIAFALSAVNVLIHARDGYTAVVPDGLILSVLAVLILLATAMPGLSLEARRTRGAV